MHIYIFMNIYLFKLSKFKVRGSSMLSRFSCVQLFATLWTVAHQASLSVGFSRQEYWNRLLCVPQGEHPHPRIDLQTA